VGDDLAASNANRSYSLAGTSIAIFTFMLVFLYPRFTSGEVDAWLFQAALVVMGVATFSFVFSSLYYYGTSLGSGRIDDVVRARYARRGDRFWLLGYTLLFLAPSVILYAVGLLVVGSAWFGLWLVYVLFVTRFFPRVQTTPKG
jgi:O-antigen/teichoic acid export membrane protein